MQPLCSKIYQLSISAEFEALLMQALFVSKLRIGFYLVARGRQGTERILQVSGARPTLLFHAAGLL